jgi:hypothetical protein
MGRFLSHSEAQKYAEQVDLEVVTRTLDINEDVYFVRIGSNNFKFTVTQRDPLIVSITGAVTRVINGEDNLFTLLNGRLAGNPDISAGQVRTNGYFYRKYTKMNGNEVEQETSRFMNLEHLFNHLYADIAENWKDS